MFWRRPTAFSIASLTREWGFGGTWSKNLSNHYVSSTDCIMYWWLALDCDSRNRVIRSHLCSITSLLWRPFIWAADSAGISDRLSIKNFKKSLFKSRYFFPSLNAERVESSSNVWHLTSTLFDRKRWSITHSSCLCSSWSKHPRISYTRMWFWISLLLSCACNITAVIARKVVATFV